MPYIKQTWDDKNPLFPTSARRLDYMEEGIASVTDLVEGFMGDQSSTRVSALPLTPFHGQRVAYTASDSGAILWHLQYNANSVSPYKWEFIGGTELFDRIDTNNAGWTNTTFADLANIGPSVTVPLMGDYDLEYAAHLSTSGASYAQASPAIGATAADAADAIEMYGNSGGSSGNISRRIRKTVTAGGTLIRMKYKLNVASGSGTARFRHLAVRPVRVGI